MFELFSALCSLLSTMFIFVEGCILSAKTIKPLVVKTIGGRQVRIHIYEYDLSKKQTGFASYQKVAAKVLAAAKSTATEDVLVALGSASLDELAEILVHELDQSVTVYNPAFFLSLKNFGRDNEFFIFYEKGLKNRAYFMPTIGHEIAHVVFEHWLREPMPGLEHMLNISNHEEHLCDSFGEELSGIKLDPSELLKDHLNYLLGMNMIVPEQIAAIMGEATKIFAERK